MPRRALALLIAALAAAPAWAQPAGPVASERATFRVSVVASGLEHPWGLAFLPDGRMLVTERPGRVRLVSREGALSPPLAGAPAVFARGQGGLHDVLLHREFARTGLVYFCHAAEGPGGVSTAVSRGRLTEGGIEGVATIFAAMPRTGGVLHFGCRMVWDGEGFLHLSLGDRMRPEQSQDLASHNGKTLRLTEDGRPAPGNPFADRPGAMPEIWTLGHRNLQAMTVHPETGRIWVVDHGPRGGDEVNLLQAGANYGWPRATHGINYDGSIITEHRSLPGMVDPLWVWVPLSIAPSGAAFYAGSSFPGWRGDLLVGGLRERALVRLRMEGGRPVAEERIPLGERIRDVRMGPDGRVYLLTDSPRGAIWRLDPA
ncbi:MAG: PQQ-dependent sugar dehydrogenase [Acetobacteraceae bacterium]|nr:PQQ-dependent sugar dehydrogenase [Acetobacteraceae bacterium]